MAISRPRYYKRKRRKEGKFRRGYYRPLNEDKYLQPADRTMNSQLWPEYRSSWEKAFMQYLDKNPNVTSWSTESIAIPYISPKDNKKHRYFPDFFMILDGKKFIVEIKPYNQCESPINKAKWESARKYASEIGAEFVVVTEKELKQWKLI